MGQSINAGWVATINGRSQGPPVLIDGYANGWRVDPANLKSALHNGTVTVMLQWAPQRRVLIGLVISALSILACLFLAFLPRRWRRLVRRHRRNTSGGHRNGLRSTVPMGTSTGKADIRQERARVMDPDDDEAPQLVVPFGTEGTRTSLLASMGIGMATGAVAGIITLPATGAIVGAATIAALMVPRARTLLGMAAAACVLAAGIYVVARQGSAHIPAGGSWPSQFEPANSLAWAGVVFLGADATVEVVRRWHATRRRNPADFRD
jgi:hypothetical protein